VRNRKKVARSNFRSSHSPNQPVFVNYKVKSYKSKGNTTNFMIYKKDKDKMSSKAITNFTLIPKKRRSVKSNVS